MIDDEIIKTKIDNIQNLIAKYASIMEFKHHLEDKQEEDIKKCMAKELNRLINGI